MTPTKEQSEKAAQANFLDDFSEHLKAKYVHWLFAKHSSDAGFRENRDAVVDFLEWVLEDTKGDLSCERGRSGLSYEEARRIVSKAEGT